MATLNMRHYPLQFIVQVDFLIVQMPSTYNVILKQQGLNTFCAVVSTYCLKMKFLMAYGIREIHRNQSLVHHYYHIALHETKVLGAYPIEGLDTYDDLAKRGEPIGDLSSSP